MSQIIGNQQRNAHPGPYRNWQVGQTSQKFMNGNGKQHRNRVDVSFYGPASHLQQDNRHCVERDVSTSLSSVTISQRHNPGDLSVASDVDRWDLHGNPKRRRSGSMTSRDKRWESRLQWRNITWESCYHFDGILISNNKSSWSQTAIKSR